MGLTPEQRQTIEEAVGKFTFDYCEVLRKLGESNRSAIVRLLDTALMIINDDSMWSHVDERRQQVNNILDEVRSLI